jgi:ABC-type multidrug transport system ATPase subunit
MMKMHGLGDGAYFSVQYLWFLLLYCAYMAVLIIVASAVNIGFFRRNSYGLQIVFYFVWGNCLVAFGFVLSTFFRVVKTAVVFGYLYTIGSGLLGYLLYQQLIERGYSWVWVLELIPSFALYRGLYEFAQYAFKAGYGNGDGLSFGNINDGFNGMSVAMGIMAVEWAIFLVLAWYLEQVLSSGTGVRRSPLFFLDSAKKRRRRRSGTVVDAAPPRPQKSVDGDLGVPLEGDDVADERLRVASMPTDGSGDSIVVRGLRKIYPAQDGNPPKVAVKGLDLGIRRGEVFGLLGPNGAGKTSAIHMMIGFLEPTAGTASIEGLDIREDMSAVYALMGVCPQHDLLWEQLTPVEHLNFYGRLKGLKGEQLAAAVEAGLRAVNLWNVRRKQVGQFSGGMKRRLSVAVSFVGDPAVVYLDEPSTGLDPASRRNLWEVVKKSRSGRGIVLTTHSMEEAEVLCDRLGIFVDGQLVCIGAPKEITARYGGYLVFTITTAHADADLEAADALVRSLSPGARRTYALGGTQKYELPTAEVSLSQVFATMERAKGSLNVLDWGVANATLEEVFIKFARQIGAEGEK